MRRSLSKIGINAAQAAQTVRKSLETEPAWPQSALKRQRRRSRSRCSDVPEAFYVLEGAVDFVVDGETNRCESGAFIQVPDGAVHAFAAVGDHPARILILNAPGRMHEDFFTSIGRPVPPDRKLPEPMDGPPDIAHVLSVAARVGLTVMPPPGA